jgi:hypothetical protein
MGEVWDASRLADSLGECRERTRKLETALREALLYLDDPRLSMMGLAYQQEAARRVRKHVALSDTEDSDG